MSIFVPNENHIHILNEIGKWKVLSLSNLYSELGNSVDYSSFCKTIKKIEKEGLISSFQGYRCKKYYHSPAREASYQNIPPPI